MRNIKNHVLIETLLKQNLTVSELIVLQFKCNRLAWEHCQTNNNLFIVYSNLRNKIKSLIKQAVL